jgi:hypothetical protein
MRRPWWHGGSALGGARSNPLNTKLPKSEEEVLAKYQQGPRAQQRAALRRDECLALALSAPTCTCASPRALLRSRPRGGLWGRRHGGLHLTSGPSGARNDAKKALRAEGAMADIRPLLDDSAHTSTDGARAADRHHRPRKPAGAWQLWEDCSLAQIVPAHTRPGIHSLNGSDFTSLEVSGWGKPAAKKNDPMLRSKVRC